MPESPRPISILDARLAEIDRRLGAIQTGLTDADGEAAEGDAESAASVPPASKTEPDTPPARALPPRVPVSEPAAATPTRHATSVVPARLGDPGPAPPEAAELIAELRQLAATQARLLDSLGELVSAYQRTPASPSTPGTPSTPSTPGSLPTRPTPRTPSTPRTPPTRPTPQTPATFRAPATLGELTVSAGPLASTEALHGFERTLSRIPEVRRVEVRGYEGGDRAIVDVQLFDPTS